MCRRRPPGGGTPIIERQKWRLPVSAAAGTHLHPNGLTLVVEGDAAVIRDDLVAAGIGDVVDAEI